MLQPISYLSGQKGDARMDKIGVGVGAEMLVGKSLDGFSVQEYTEVYSTNEDGLKSGSLGFFSNPTLAAAYADSKPGRDYGCSTAKVLLLTDGKAAFLLGEAAELVDEAKVAKEVKDIALEKLSPAEREFLGIK